MDVDITARIKDPESLDTAVPVSRRDPTANEPITVWRKVREVEETCSLGCTHRVTHWARKLLKPTGEFRPHNNGYEVHLTPLRVDAQGRIYHQHVEIDYYSNISWVRDGDKERFYQRPRGGDAQKNELTGELIS
jgi:hypothetical protein